MRIGVLGMATVDTILHTPDPDFEHEGVTLLERAASGIGGKGLVAAIAAHHGGSEILPCALVGRRSTIEPAVSPIFDSRFLFPALDQDHRIWLVTSDGQEVVTFAYLGRSDPGFLTTMRKSAESFVDQVDLLYLSMEHPLLVNAAVERAAARNIPLVANLCSPLLTQLGSELDQIIRASHIILCNEHEERLAFRELGVKNWSSVEAEALTQVVVTAGAKGGTWSTAPFKQWTGYEGFPADVVCVVGAGDTFNGQYLSSVFTHGHKPAEACISAAELAAKKVSVFSSSLPITGLDVRFRE